MRLRRLLATLTTAIACSGASVGAFEVVTEELNRGTTLVVVEDHRTRLVRVVLEFPVGRASPWGFRNGIGEAFRVQSHDPEGTLRSRADRLALDLSVQVGDRAARVTADCLSDDLDAAIALLGDLTRNRSFDRRRLKSWSRENRLEWNFAQKDPQSRLRQAAARSIFEEGDPRRRPFEKPAPLSTDTEALATTRDRALALAGRVIAFSGDVEIERATALARDLLPPVDGSAPPDLAPLYPRSRPAERNGEEIVVPMGKIAQAFFAYTRPSLTYDDPRYPAFRVADHVLGGHFFSRLSVALRHEGGETYGTTTVGHGTTEVAAYALVTFTRPENAATTKRKLEETLRRFHESGITEAERSAAVGSMQGRLPFSRQSPKQVLGRYLWERRHGLEPGFVDGLTDRAAGTSLAEVNELIREFFDPAYFRMIEVSPDRPGGQPGRDE